MNTQTVNQLTPSATSTCFMAIELSNTVWLIGMMTPLSDKISLRKIDSGAVSAADRDHRSGHREGVASHWASATDRVVL